MVYKMPLSDTWLKANNGKKTEKRIEKSDRDGLSVRVTPKGKITFQIRYRHNGKAARVDLGSYPSMSLKQARKENLRLKGMLEKGYDLRMVKRLEKKEIIQADSLESAFRKWFESYCIPNKKESSAIIRSFEIHVFPEIGDLPIKRVGVNEWLVVLEKSARDRYGIALRLLANAKQALKWCVRRGLIDTNPLSEISAREDLNIKGVSSERYLSNEEIRMLWLALDKSMMASKSKVFAKLCLFYGCRNGELRNAEKKHFDFERMIWTIPPENHKAGYRTNKPLIRPIINEVIPLIKSAFEESDGEGFIFTSSRTGGAMTQNSCGSIVLSVDNWLKRNCGYEMASWSMHDLRKTVRTNMSSITEPHIAEMILGHKLPGVWQVYDKYEYLEEQAKAYKKWWDRLMNIVSE